MIHQRPHLKVVKKRLEGPRRFIQVLSGPRQVGKTTLVEQFIQGSDAPALFVSADGVASDASRVWIAQQWETARLRLASKGGSEMILAIDEIQKIPNWSEAVKREWDEDTRRGIPLKIILLGSSRLLLQAGLTESLAGRFETIHMGHWTLGEMEAAFGWDAATFAWFGGYPGAASLIHEEGRWKDYVAHSLVDAAISRDILMLSRVDKPALMRRLFDLGCACSGQILSYTKMLGQLSDAGNTVTLAHYLELLDTAGLLAGLEKYAGDTLRQRASSPKFQVRNTALLSALAPVGFEQARADATRWGRVVESAIGAHLLNAARDGLFGLHYWRDGGNEIDFVLARGGEILGIEVKSGAGLRAGGAAAFQKRHPAARLLLVGGEALPWEEFLRMDPACLLRAPSGKCEG
jgi:predicted AAA+ superfamily ATPase